MPQRTYKEGFAFIELQEVTRSLSEKRQGFIWDLQHGNALAPAPQEERQQTDAGRRQREDPTKCFDSDASLVCKTKILKSSG